MNRLLTAVIAAAASLGCAALVTAAPASAAGAAHPARPLTAGATGDNSSYGSSAPDGPHTAAPQGLAQSTGHTTTIVNSVGISGLLSTGIALDTASTTTAFSRVSSVRAHISGSGHVLSLTASQISSTCRSDTVTASASIVGGVLTEDGVSTVLPPHPTVDESIPIAGGTLTLNRHISASGGGVEAQGFRLHFTGTTPTQDLYVAISVCNRPGTTANTITVDNPGDQTDDSGTPITRLPIDGDDTDTSQVLTYTATGLPPGLSIDSSTGVISGTPTTATGSPFSVTVTATDTTGASGSTSFTWTINNVVAVTNPGSQSGVVGTVVSLPIIASDSDASQTLTYGASGLPPGLSIDTSTGVISGTPTTATGSPFSVTVTATDGLGFTDSATFSFTITSPM
jgi:putative Ig domain-containing protein